MRKANGKKASGIRGMIGLALGAVICVGAIFGGTSLGTLKGQTVQAAQGRTVNVFIDGQKITSDPAAFIEKNRTMLPVRAVFESLGYKVDWNESSRTAVATKVMPSGWHRNVTINTTDLIMTITETQRDVDGRTVKMPNGREAHILFFVPLDPDNAPLVIKENRLMLPVAVIAATIGSQIQWDGNTFTATINTAGSKIIPPTGWAEAMVKHCEKYAPGQLWLESTWKWEEERNPQVVAYRDQGTTPTPVATPTPSATPIPTATPTPSATPAPSLDSMVAQVLASSNAERAKLGIAPLVLSAQLTVMAQAHTDDMAQAGFFSHTSPRYGSFSDRIKLFNVSASAENIHYGSTTAQGAVASWMASTQGHREAILNSSHTQIGIGYAISANGRPYWTQIFSRTAVSATPTPTATPAPTVTPSATRWSSWRPEPEKTLLGEAYSLEVIRLVNEIRREAGLDEVVIDATLMATAQWHAEDMLATRVFSHTASNGLAHTDLAKTFGYTGRYAGENITGIITTAYGQPEYALWQWMNSPGHKAHILRDVHKYIGVGYVDGYACLFMGY